MSVIVFVIVDVRLAGFNILGIFPDPNSRSDEMMTTFKPD